MSDDLVFLDRFWPTPTTPARITVELTVAPNGENGWDYRAEVNDCRGVGRVVGGQFEAASKQHADLKGMYKLVGLLAEMLADATKDV